MALDATALTLVLLGVGIALTGLGVRSLRPGRAGLVVVGVLLVAAGAVFGLVAGDEALDVADAPVLGWAIALRSPGRTALAETVSLVGGTTFTGGLAVVAAVVLLLRGRRRRAVVWVVGVAIGALTIRLLKVTVERPRPPIATRLAEETTASLPSGHSLMAALGLGLATAAVVALTRGARHATVLRVVVTVLAVLAVAAIGAGRAYLGVHWSTDVLAGWLLGAALAAACVTVAQVLERRTGPEGRDGRPDDRDDVAAAPEVG